MSSGDILGTHPGFIGEAPEAVHPPQCQHVSKYEPRGCAQDIR